MLSTHDEPFVAVEPDSGELCVSFPPVLVKPLPPGRRNTEAERGAQRAEILDAALRSVERSGAVGLQPEKVVTVIEGSVTSQSMRRAFKAQLDESSPDGRRRSLRDVLEDELITVQLRGFDAWLNSDKARTLASEREMVDGLERIARALLTNTALIRLRVLDRERLEAFLGDDARSAPLTAALCSLAVRCLRQQGQKRPDPDRVRTFVRLNLRLLADDVALRRLADDDGAECFVRHLRRFSTR